MLCGRIHRAAYEVTEWHIVVKAVKEYCHTIVKQQPDMVTPTSTPHTTRNGGGGGAGVMLETKQSGAQDMTKADMDKVNAKRVARQMSRAMSRHLVNADVRKYAIYGAEQQKQQEPQTEKEHNGNDTNVINA